MACQGAHDVKPFRAGHRVCSFASKFALTTVTAMHAELSLAYRSYSLHCCLSAHFLPVSMCLVGACSFKMCIFALSIPWLAQLCFSRRGRMRVATLFGCRCCFGCNCFCFLTSCLVSQSTTRRITWSCRQIFDFVFLLNF